MKTFEEQLENFLNEFPEIKYSGITIANHDGNNYVYIYKNGKIEANEELKVAIKNAIENRDSELN